MIDTDLDVRLSAMEKKIDDMHAVVMRMRRAQITARNRKVLYWAVIIALGVISYYSIKPYLEQIQSLTDTAGDYGALLNSINQ